MCSHRGWRSCLCGARGLALHERQVMSFLHSDVTSIGPSAFQAFSLRAGLGVRSEPVTTPLECQSMCLRRGLAPAPVVLAASHYASAR
jgi:hypothetical protein